MERFTGILLENTAGHLPLWLAPVQAKVCTIVSDADAYAEEVLAALKRPGLRAEIDLRNEKINYKVREHSLAKVPVLLVVGKREAEEKTVSVRRLGAQQQQVMPLAEAIATLADEAVPPDLKRASQSVGHGSVVHPGHFVVPTISSGPRGSTPRRQVVAPGAGLPGIDAAGMTRKAARTPHQSAMKVARVSVTCLMLARSTPRRSRGCRSRWRRRRGWGCRSSGRRSGSR